MENMENYTPILPSDGKAHDVFVQHMNFILWRLRIKHAYIIFVAVINLYNPSTV